MSVQYCNFNSVQANLLVQTSLVTYVSPFSSLVCRFTRFLTELFLTELYSLFEAEKDLECKYAAVNVIIRLCYCFIGLLWILDFWILLSFCCQFPLNLFSCPVVPLYLSLLLGSLRFHPMCTKLCKKFFVV